VSSRYGDWAVEDVQSRSGSPESSIHHRALDLPVNCLAGKKGEARGDREELLPVETARIQEAPFATPASARREATEPNVYGAGDGEGVHAAIVGAASLSSSSSSSQYATSSTITNDSSSSVMW
jgi:hypothetical protein